MMTSFELHHNDIIIMTSLYFPQVVNCLPGQIEFDQAIKAIAQASLALQREEVREREREREGEREGGERGRGGREGGSTN